MGAAYTKERRMRFETNYFMLNSTQDMIFSVVAVKLRSKSLHRGLSTSRAHNTTARTTSQLYQKVLLLECLKKHNLSNAIKARLLNCLKKRSFSHFLKGTTSNILKKPKFSNVLKVQLLKSTNCPKKAQQILKSATSQMS